MANDEMPPPIRLMNFVSEDQLEEARRTRGVRVEDGTAQRDRSLYEILKENKDKKDAEFNERFKHRPPKALDEDETEFLDKLEMSRREYEQQMADEEKQQLQSFQAAVATHSMTVNELKEAPTISRGQDKKSVPGRKSTTSRLLGTVIKVKPQAKKAKTDRADAEETSSLARSPNVDTKETWELGKVSGVDTTKFVTSVEKHKADSDESRFVTSSSLVSYSDESEEED